MVCPEDSGQMCLQDQVVHENGPTFILHLITDTHVPGEQKQVGLAWEELVLELRARRSISYRAATSTTKTIVRLTQSSWTMLATG